MKVRATAVAAALALALAGCATVSDAPAGAYSVGQSYSVTLGRQWADISAIMPGRPKNIRLLSIDGPFLNRLYLSEGLGPGDFLVKPAAKDRPTPIFHANSTPNEIIEFVADSVAALDYQQVETANLRPGSAWGGTDALRFDIRAKSKTGLDISGSALTAVRNGRLYVILYLAPSEHYYAVNLAEVEAIMRSVVLREKS